MELWRRHSYRVSAVIFKPYISIVNGWNNYIRTWRRERVGTWCVIFQSADLFVLRTVSLKYYISKINLQICRKAVCESRLSFNVEIKLLNYISSHTIASRRSSQLVFEGTEKTRIILVLFPYISLSLIVAWKGKRPLTFFGLRLGS